MPPLSPEEKCGVLAHIAELEEERDLLIAKDAQQRPDERFWIGVRDAITEKVSEIEQMRRLR